MHLIHCRARVCARSCGGALECLQAERLSRAIGVSNYTVGHLEEMLGHAQMLPAVNQVEFHPFMYQRELLEWVRERGVARLDVLDEGLRTACDPTLVP